MKVEFILKDCDGVDLSEDDFVEWICESVSIKPTMFGIVYDMWNSGQVIKGRVVFDRTNLHLLFVSDDEQIKWSIRDLTDDHKHMRLKKM